MKLVAISDTHEKHRRIKVPDGDILIFAGDATLRGEKAWIEDFNVWLGELPHKYKVGVLGNHELTCDSKHERFVEGHKELFTNLILLEDSSIEIEGLKFWGSPYQPEFHNWAFNYPRTPEGANEHWNKIPMGIDVLITHGPPLGVLDTVRPGYPHLGCSELRNAVEAAKPKFHVFGHIHGGAGSYDMGETLYINAAVLDEAYSVTARSISWELK